MHAGRKQVDVISKKEHGATNVDLKNSVGLLSQRKMLFMKK